MTTRQRLQKVIKERHPEKDDNRDDEKVPELPKDLEGHAAVARNTIQSQLLVVDKSLKQMGKELTNKGITKKRVKEAMNKEAIEIEKKVKQRPEGLDQNPLSGSTKESAIVITTFFQETMLLKELTAQPIRWYMFKENDKYYDEVLCLRLARDLDACKARGHDNMTCELPTCKPSIWKQCSVFFDVTNIHEEIKRITGRDTTNKPFYGLMACAACQKKNDDNKMKHCTRCKSVVYCNRECQTKHYQAGHRADCLGVSKEYEAAKEADAKQSAYFKKAAEEEKAQVSNEKGMRYLAFELRADIRDILQLYINTVVDEADIHAELKVERVHLNHTGELDNDKAVEALSQLQAIEFNLIGLGWRKAFKDEPQDCEVICALLDDVTNAMPACLSANGCNTKTYLKKSIQVDFLQMKKGTAEKYVDAARSSTDILEIHGASPIDKRSEYLHAILQTNEFLSDMCEFDIKEDISKRRLEMIEKIKIASMTDEWVIVDKLRVASAGVAPITVTLRPHVSAMDRMKQEQVFVTEHKAEKTKTDAPDVEEMGCPKSPLSPHMSFD